MYFTFREGEDVSLKNNSDISNVDFPHTLLKSNTSDFFT